MYIRRTDQKNQVHISAPSVGISRENLEGDQQCQTPHFRDNTQKHALVESLRNPCDDQQVDDEYNVCRDGEQVRLERSEIETLELQGNIVCCGRVGNAPDETKGINRPKVIVTKCTPKHLRRQGLSVVHASLTGVVAEDTVDHNLFLALVEPAILSAETTLCLCRSCRHPEHRDDSDKTGEQALESKQISPSAGAVALSDMQESKGEECTDNGCSLVRNPEITQSNWQLSGLVPEREEQDRIGDTGSQVSKATGMSGSASQLHSQSTLNQTQKSATDKITGSVFDKCLESSNETPHDHLDRNPTIRSELLGQQLRRQLCEEENEEEYCLAGVIVIGVHAQVLEHIIRHCLDDVSSIKLERKEGNACESTNSDIDLFHQHRVHIIKKKKKKGSYLPNETLLFAFFPLEVRIPSVYPFVC